LAGPTLDGTETPAQYRAMLVYVVILVVGLVLIIKGGDWFVGARVRLAGLLLMPDPDVFGGESADEGARSGARLPSGWGRALASGCASLTARTSSRLPVSRRTRMTGIPLCASPRTGPTTASCWWPPTRRRHRESWFGLPPASRLWRNCHRRVEWIEPEGCLSFCPAPARQQRLSHCGGPPARTGRHLSDTSVSV